MSDEITSESDLSDISGSEIELESENSDSEEEFKNESVSDKRRRLAKEYLESIEKEVENDNLNEHNNFDAGDIDKDIIASRLKQEAAHSNGRIYKFLSSKLVYLQEYLESNIEYLGKFSKVPSCVTVHSLTGLARINNFVYTISSDGRITIWNVLIDDNNLEKGKKQQQQHKKQNKQQQEQLLNAPLREHLTSMYLKRFKRVHRTKHTNIITCIATSPNGKYVVTGGCDKRIIIHDSKTLTPLKIFTQHRDSVLGLSFRMVSNSQQLYSCSADRTIKSWSLDSMSYVETLYGHQDQVSSIAGFAMERCVSVGSRDRTVRVWKIVEESQLVFKADSGIKVGDINSTDEDNQIIPSKTLESLDVVIALDDGLFITGADNGNISLWSTGRKRALHTLNNAHGFDIKQISSADLTYQEEKVLSKFPSTLNIPRYITALASIPFSDIFASGSWDGNINLYKVNISNRTFDLLFKISGANGIVNSISLHEYESENGKFIQIIAAVGKELRTGRWLRKGKNGIFTASVPLLEPTHI